MYELAQLAKKLKLDKVLSDSPEILLTGPEDPSAVREWRQRSGCSPRSFRSPALLLRSAAPNLGRRSPPASDRYSGWPGWKRIALRTTAAHGGRAAESCRRGRKVPLSPPAAGSSAVFLKLPGRPLAPARMPCLMWDWRGHRCAASPSSLGAGW